MKNVVLPLALVSLYGACFGVDDVRIHPLMPCKKRFLSKIKVKEKVSCKVKKFAKKALIASAVIVGGVIAYRAAPFIKSYAKSLALRLGIVKQPVVENGCAKNLNYFKHYIAPSTFFTLATFFTYALRLYLSVGNSEAWQSDTETEYEEIKSPIVSENLNLEDNEDILSQESNDTTLVPEDNILEEGNNKTESNEENIDVPVIENEEEVISEGNGGTTLVPEDNILEEGNNKTESNEENIDESEWEDISDEEINILKKDCEQSNFVIQLIKSQFETIPETYDSRYKWIVYNGQISGEIERVSNENLKSELYNQLESLKKTQDTYVQIFASGNKSQMRDQLLTAPLLIPTALKKLEQSRKMIEQ